MGFINYKDELNKQLEGLYGEEKIVCTEGTILYEDEKANIEGDHVFALIEAVRGEKKYAFIIPYVKYKTGEVTLLNMMEEGLTDKDPVDMSIIQLMLNNISTLLITSLMDDKIKPVLTEETTETVLDCISCSGNFVDEVVAGDVYSSYHDNYFKVVKEENIPYVKMVQSDIFGISVNINGVTMPRHILGEDKEQLKQTYDKYAKRFIDPSSIKQSEAVSVKPIIISKFIRNLVEVYHDVIICIEENLCVYGESYDDRLFALIYNKKTGCTEIVEQSEDLEDIKNYMNNEESSNSVIKGYAMTELETVLNMMGLKPDDFIADKNTNKLPRFINRNGKIYEMLQPALHYSRSHRGFAMLLKNTMGDKFIVPVRDFCTSGKGDEVVPVFELYK